jgi:hypothetical protein
MKLMELSSAPNRKQIQGVQRRKWRARQDSNL